MVERSWLELHWGRWVKRQDLVLVEWVVVEEMYMFVTIIINTLINVVNECCYFFFTFRSGSDGGIGVEGGG